MSIQDWGAIGEVIAAVAVVVSLLYLAAQIRQNTRQSEIQSSNLRQTIYTATGESFSAFRSLIIGDSETAEIWRKASQSPSLLDESELVRADYLIQEYFVSFMIAYVNSRELALEQRIDHAMWIKDAMDYELRKSGIREWWRGNRNRFNLEDFRESMDAIVASYDEC